MLREFLDRVAELARNAATPQVLESGDPRKIRVAYGGVIDSWDREPPLRNHHVLDLDSLIDWAAPRDEDAALRTPTVWHSPAGVVVVLDDDDRRDLVTFNLTLTLAAKSIVDLHSANNERRPWQQRELIRFLRCDLGLPPAVVAPWRRLDWDNSSKTASLAEHGRDRMGRDVAVQVVGASDLPEVIAVPLILYEQPGEQAKYQILLNVELAPLEQRIYLAPQPLALENAVAAHQETIRARLLESLTSSARIYYGLP